MIFLQAALTVCGVIGILDLTGVLAYINIHNVTAIWIVLIFVFSTILSVRSLRTR